jgi:ribosomal protein S21
VRDSFTGFVTGHTTIKKKVSYKKPTKKRSTKKKKTKRKSKNLFDLDFDFKF